MIDRLTAGTDAVVTAYAAINDRCMVHRRRHPRGDTVAIVTRLRGGNMLRMLAARNNTVMTRSANAQHLRVINAIGDDRYPRRGTGIMTGVALIGGINMLSALTRRNNAVVTTRTNANDLRMIDRGRTHRKPRRRTNRVTRITLIASGNVRR